jgi:hypothetical protein
MIKEKEKKINSKNIMSVYVNLLNLWLNLFNRNNKFKKPSKLNLQLIKY